MRKISSLHHNWNHAKLCNLNPLCNIKVTNVQLHLVAVEVVGFIFTLKKITVAKTFTVTKWHTQFLVGLVLLAMQPNVISLSEQGALGLFLFEFLSISMHAGLSYFASQLRFAVEGFVMAFFSILKGIAAARPRSLRSIVRLRFAIVRFRAV